MRRRVEACAGTLRSRLSFSSRSPERHRSDYRVNDLPVFSITPKEDCHLTLINVDASGESTVIFPNTFQQDNPDGGKKVSFRDPTRRSSSSSRIRAPRQ